MITLGAIGYLRLGARATGLRRTGVPNPKKIFTEYRLLRINRAWPPGTHEVDSHFDQLRGGCVTGWNVSVARWRGATAAAEPARSPPAAASRRRHVGPRGAAIMLCTVLLIGCGVGTVIWPGQLTPLAVAYALSAMTAVILAWISVRSLGHQ